VDPSQRSIVVDVSALVEPDPLILDALVRLQLAAQRLGSSIRLENACPRLVDLLAVAGLAEVLPALAASAVEVNRQVEQREEILIDEEVGPADAPA
jgi:hypothetical protein